MAKHHLTHAEEVEGGQHSHEHHHKLHAHHLKEAAKHAKHLHRLAKKGGHRKEHITAHDRAVDRRNLAKAIRAK
jgi:hypothetical protein